MTTIITAQFSAPRDRDTLAVVALQLADLAGLLLGVDIDLALAVGASPSISGLLMVGLDLFGPLDAVAALVQGSLARLRLR